MNGHGLSGAPVASEGKAENPPGRKENPTIKNIRVAPRQYLETCFLNDPVTSKFCTVEEHIHLH